MPLFVFSGDRKVLELTALDFLSELGLSGTDHETLADVLKETRIAPPSTCGYIEGPEGTSPSCHRSDARPIGHVHRRPACCRMDIIRVVSICKINGDGHTSVGDVKRLGLSHLILGPPITACGV